MRWTSCRSDGAAEEVDPDDAEAQELALTEAEPGRRDEVSPPPRVGGVDEGSDLFGSEGFDLAVLGAGEVDAPAWRGGEQPVFDRGVITEESAL